MPSPRETGTAGRRSPAGRRPRIAPPYDFVRLLLDEQRLADRIRMWPQTAGEHLVDDNGLPPGLRMAIIEPSSANNGYSQCLEIACCDKMQRDAKDLSWPCLSAVPERHRDGAWRKSRRETDECECLHRAERFDPSLHLAKVICSSCPIVATQAGPHPGVRDVLRVEAGNAQRPDALHQEDGADQQDDGERDLRDQEHRAKGGTTEPLRARHLGQRQSQRVRDATVAGTNPAPTPVAIATSIVSRNAVRSMVSAYECRTPSISVL